MSDEDDRDWGGHPLFPRPMDAEGPDPRRFDFLRISRLLPNGEPEICPRIWKGSELRSWAQIVDKYGGGTYQIRAQCGRTWRYQASTEWTVFDGPSRPLLDVVPQPEPRPKPAPVAASPPVTARLPVVVPHGFAWPDHPPQPPPSQNETSAILREMMNSHAEFMAVLVEVLLQPRKPTTNPIEVLRVLAPVLQPQPERKEDVEDILRGAQLARDLVIEGRARAEAAEKARAEAREEARARAERDKAPASSRTFDPDLN